MRFKIPSKQPSSFKGSARYLAGLTKGVTPDRVEWVFANNLQITDPETAAALMEATASRNTRCQAPAYHFILSFDKKDARRGKITPESMREIANETIERLGLAEHQALVYAHRDTDYPHMHFLINRIHPENHRALSRHSDGKRMAEHCREIARERGLNIPNDRNKVREQEPGHDRADLEATAPTDGEYWRAKRLDEQAHEKHGKERTAEIRQTVRRHFAEAMSWDVLSDVLLENGLTMRRKGQGLILDDGVGYVKLSDMGKGVRFSELEKRFGEKFDAFEARQLKALERRLSTEEEVSEPGLSDAEKRRVERRNQIKRKAASERQDRVIALDTIDIEFRYWLNIDASYRYSERNAGYWDRRVDHLDKTLERRTAKEKSRRSTLETMLAGTYRRPEQAMTLWDKLEAQHGARAATMMVKQNPAILGKQHGYKLGKMRSFGRIVSDEEYSKLAKSRRLWKYARDDVADTAQKREQASFNLERAQYDLKMMRNAVGSPERFRRIMLEKIKLRSKALSRVTAKMIAASNLAEERKDQLIRIHRKERERRRERGLKKSLGVPFDIEI